MVEEIRNARIRETHLGPEERGGLVGHLMLDYGDGTVQGFGGYEIAPRGEEQRRISYTFGADYILRTLETVGVERWEDLPGKLVRVKVWEDGFIRAIGHIIDDKWFDPTMLLAEMIGETG